MSTIQAGQNLPISIAGEVVAVANFAALPDPTTLPEGSIRFTENDGKIYKIFDGAWIDAGGAGGGGTVTSVSVTTANGVSGSVATPTTTPAISLTLGAITPTSVASSGTVTGSNLSGTNTGDQTITLSSDVTGSGTGSITATVASVGGSSAANVHTAELAANSATDANTASTIVKRDASGNFSAGTVTASLTGNASGSAASFTGSLSGDITGTQSATVVSQIAGVSVGTPTGTTNVVFSNSPSLTGVPTAPTASVGTSTTQLATTAFVLSQGFQGATGSMPFAHASSTSVVTSATTTYVTAISTTITTTAVSAPIYAKATGTFTVTGAVPTVLKYRISVNGVAGQEQLLSLTAVTTNYTAAVQYISAALAPGTYTVLFEMARNSGTGTTSFFEGTLDAIALQGTESNGISSLSGLGLSAGPGSGAQALTGTLTMAGGGSNASLVAANGAALYSTATALALLAPGTAGQLYRSGGAGAPTWTAETFPASTTINQLLYSSAANIVSGLATANTGALVTSSTGVPSITSGAVANRLLRTNATTVSFAQANLTTDVTGTLPAANGGTGVTSFASQRIPFGTGTSLTTDASFIYDTVNKRLSVNGSGTAIGNFINTGSSVALQAYNQGTNNAFQALNQSAYTCSLVSRQNNATTGASIGMEFGRGTLAVPLQALNGDQLAVIAIQAYTGTQTAPGYAGALTFVATEDCTNTANGSDFIIAVTPNTTLTPIERFRIKQSGESTFVNSHLKSTQTASTTIAATANAGTGATASLTTATDVAGSLELDLGTLSLSTGAQAIVTFSKAYNIAPIVVITPINGAAASNAAAFGIYVTSSTTTFTINFASAGVALSTLQWNYHVIETQ